MQLNSKQRRHLRGLAHSLKPVVQVGHGGVSSALIAKVGLELEHHELIKVKVLGESPLDPKEVAAELVEQASCGLAQIIGRTVVLYRPRKKKPVIVLPVGKEADDDEAVPG